MPTEETPITPTVDTKTSIQEHQQSYEMGGNKRDLKFVLEYYSQLIDAEIYRLLIFDGPKTVPLLDTVRKSCRKFLKVWLEDGSWLVCTQLSGGDGLYKMCIVMQSRLKLGSIRNVGTERSFSCMKRMKT